MLKIKRTSRALPFPKTAQTQAFTAEPHRYKIGKTILETAATVLSVNETPTKTGWL